MPNRIRAEQLIIRVTSEEKLLIQKKMKQMGAANFSRYARKMLLDGHVITLDLSQFQELANEVNKVGVNINQIAKAVNATGSVQAADINRLKEMMEELWRLLKLSLSDLLSKSR